ncbi:MAG: polysaccharide biosynthesis protein [Lachnospiraceae bacterium]|nr:polysaccharide biosynthesis protein [Lachnospiraceae bacterium]
MAENRKKDGFVMQAGILAAAGIICRIIGLLYKSPLTGIIGDEGNGYYGFAYNIYTIILLISSYSIPSAISKVIAQKLELKEYRNAHKIFKCALLYVVLVGGAASLFAFFGAGILVPPNSVPVLRIFAPTIFLSGLLGVLRGYFQAHKTMIQTSVSQIVEQILNAVVSIGAAYLFMKMVANKDATTKAVYGAMGSALGTGLGVLTALLFMLAIYMMNRKLIMQRIKRDVHHKEESEQEVFKMILSVVTPFILSTCIYNLTTSLNQTLYTKIFIGIKGVAEEVASSAYGVFSIKAMTVVNIPVAFASAMSSAVIPSISGCFARGEKKEAKRKIHQAIHTVMLISIPSAVGLFVLAEPVMGVLFPQKESLELAASLLRYLSVTVMFYGLSTLSNGILQGIGKVNVPVKNAAIALVLQTVVIVPLLIYTDLNLYCFVIATIIYSFAMCILNSHAMKKAMNYKEKIGKTYIMPMFSAAIMGVAAWGVYHGMYILIQSNLICLATAVMVAVMVYFVVLIKIGGLTEKELKAMPKGTLLVRAAKKMHLMK